MVTFALIAVTAALLAGVLLVWPLVMRRGEAAGQDAIDAQVFRDQLAELDRDLDRGTISEAEAQGARVEISRRLLKAAERAKASGAIKPAPQGLSGLIAGIALMGAPVLAAGIYIGVGQPGMPDRPLAERAEEIAALRDAAQPRRPSQEEAEAELARLGMLPPAPSTDPRYAQLVAQLEQVLEQRPDDIQGHGLYANALMNLGRFAEARRVYEKIIGLLGDAADAETYATLSEAMVLAAGGYVSPEAERSIARALQIDPGLPLARYYGGLALRQAGRIDEAVAMWQKLRAESPPGAPYLPYLDQMLAETRAPQAGGSMPGPSREDIEAAQEMSPEEQRAMIEGMVAGLEERLTTEGGEAEEWYRLMFAYVRLDRRDDAKRIYELARAALGDVGGAGFMKEQALLLGLDVE